jgi:hypothetical protein
LNETPNPYVVPIGPGGLLGRTWRFIAMLFTAGFLYPNTCVEGLNLTAIQNQHEGTLYDKK